MSRRASRRDHSFFLTLAPDLGIFSTHTLILCLPLVSGLFLDCLPLVFHYHPRIETLDRSPELALRRRRVKAGKKKENGHSLFGKRLTPARPIAVRLGGCH